MSRAAVAAAAAALALALPAAADAHSLVRPGGAVVNYLAADATSLNTLTVTLGGGRITFRDPSVDGGMDPGSCDPGDVSDAGAIVSASCPADGVARVRLELGEREDTATVRAALPATVLGGPGADTLTGGPAADSVDGGEGDDRVGGGPGSDLLEGGAGADRLDGGDGDDELRARDGLPDTVACGAGADRVLADTLDEAAADCEQVHREATPPPPGGGPTGDKVAPMLFATASRTQRVARSRRIRLVAVTTEPGAVAASGVLDVDGAGLPLETRRRPVAVAGGGVELALTLSRSEHRRVLRALRRGRPVRVALTVVATDAAGNSRARRLPVIRLRR